MKNVVQALRAELVAVLRAMRRAASSALGLTAARATFGAIRALLLAVTIVASTGCSVVLVAPPSSTTSRARDSWLVHEECTQSVAAPVVDAVLGTAFAAASVASAVAASRTGPPSSPSDCADSLYYCSTADYRGALYVLAVIAAASAVAYGVSAAYGFVRTAECRALPAAAPWAPAVGTGATAAPGSTGPCRVATGRADNAPAVIARAQRDITACFGQGSAGAFDLILDGDGRASDLQNVTENERVCLAQVLARLSFAPADVATRVSCHF